MCTELFPASLVQIHYHNRHGGVRQVIRSYAEAFRTLAGDNAPNILVSSETGSAGNMEGIKAVSIPECDYVRFSSSSHFYTLYAVLADKISRFLSTSNLPEPVLVICHNMTLGKNPALSSALGQIASACSRKFRFFWVVHDFVEEGRQELLNSLQMLQDTGVPAMSKLYALGAPVQYVVPAAYSQLILHAAGITATVLDNPLNHSAVTLSDEVQEKVICAFRRLSIEDGTGYNSEKPTFCYPARILHRKNFPEAILLACIVFGCNLVTGSPGYGVEDRKRFEWFKKIAQRFSCPVVFNPGKRITWSDIFPEATANPVPVLYSSCNYALSTSVAEGFGYALYEPWMYHRMLIGRVPTGFSYPQQMSSASLYTRFPVPVSLISPSLQKEASEENGREKRELICDGTVDFAILPEQEQCALLEKVLENSRLRSQWLDLLLRKIDGWPGSSYFMRAETSLIDQNRSVLEKRFSKQRYLQQFRETFSRVPEMIPETVDVGKISELVHRQNLGCTFEV